MCISVKIKIRNIILGFVNKMEQKCFEIYVHTITLRMSVCN